MTTLLQQEAFNVVGPTLSGVHVFAVTSTQADADMATSAAVGVAVSNGRMLRLRADGCDVYYAWAQADALTIDDAATGTNTGTCGVIPAGSYVDERPPCIGGAICSWLYVKAATGATGKLRVSVSSATPGANGV